MDLLEAIKTGWAFAGLVPRAVVDVNAFGNVLVQDEDGHYWLIVPEHLSCDLLATSEGEFQQHRSTTEFREEWAMERLVAIATATLGSPGQGQCFCLKIPAVLGGPYEAFNFGTISVAADDLVVSVFRRVVLGLSGAVHRPQ
jgi:hypothetical protein